MPIAVPFLVILIVQPVEVAPTACKSTSTRILEAVDIGVIDTDKPVTLVQDKAVDENVSVFIVCTTCKTPPDPASAVLTARVII
jgi:hypothetical protein